VLALLAVAGCGNLPRPFQPDDKPLGQSLLGRTDHAGVIVMPLSGIEDDQQARRFAESLADALRAVDVMAHNGAGKRLSPVLSSYLERRSGDDAVLTLWLSNGAGTEIGAHEIPVRARDLVADAPGRRAAMRALAERVAAELDPERARMRAMPVVHIRRVGGLPAAQAVPLERALAFWLRRAKLEIVERPDAAGVELAGGIGFRDRPPEAVAVEVVWQLLGRDGVELGRITQRNDVPAALLTSGWDEVASAIAESASEGIVDLVGRVRREAAP
jgi:hypothetical protein